MKTVKVNNVRRYGQLAFGIADINEKGEIYAAPLSFCRAYAADNLFNLKNKDKTNRTGTNYLPLDYNWKTGHTYILIEVPTYYKEAFLSNLGFLHAKEEKAGVAKSEVFKVDIQGSDIYLVKGSGHWKNKCWSQLLYTFYIKCMCVPNPTALNINGESHYWQQLRKQDSNGVTNEDKFLKAVKMRKEIFSVEVFGNKLNTGVHDREGFASICNGHNPPMSKLLNIHTGRDDNWFKNNITVINW